MTDKRERLKELRIDRGDLEATKSKPGVALAVIAAVLVILGLLGWWWYTQSRQIRVEVARVEQLSTSDTSAVATVLDASGYVVARRQATVSAKTTGKVVEVLVEEGMAVARDQVLARLDSALPERQLRLTEAQLGSARLGLPEIEVRLAEARQNLERTRRLFASEVASSFDVDSAQAEVDALTARLTAQREEITVAERQVELRRQELEDTVIRAPFAGVAVSKDAQPGEMISPVSAGGGFTRTGICTLVDMSSLEIEVDVNEAYINRVEDGQEVVATLDAYPDWAIRASVITTIPTADRQKATVQVRIAFAELDPRILPEMGVKVSFLEEQREPEVATAAAKTYLPAAAVRSSQGRDVVFVVAGDVVERRAVRVGETRDERVEILAGVAAGELVVVSESAPLTVGAKVIIE